MYNKRLSNAGFYLLLLFAFLVNVWPQASYYLAIAIFLIWLSDTIIFREVELVELPLFYPILGFNVVLILAWALAQLNGINFPYFGVGLLTLFYFIVPGFVMSGERRKMVLWSFIAGVVLVSGLHLITWWDNASGIQVGTNWPRYPLMFQIALVLCVLLAFFAEAEELKEKLFLGLVAFPPALTAILTLDKAVILVIIFSILVVGIFRDRIILIPTALAALILFSGVFGISYNIEKRITPIEYLEFVRSPLNEIQKNHKVIEQAQFFGVDANPTAAATASNVEDSFFLKMLRDAGPPVLIVFLWIIVEQTRGSLSRQKKALSREARAHHVGVLLVLAAIIIMNLYSSAFEYGSAVLAAWMIVGMTEI
jgi:hypothetical protein